MAEGLSFDDITKGIGAAAWFAITFTPGFVAMKTYDFFQDFEPRKVQDLLYEIVGYSSVSYALASPLILFEAMNRDAVTANYWYLCGTILCVFLLIPIALGWSAGAVQREAERRSKTFISSIKAPWDYAFRHRQKSIAEVDLIDGTTIAGQATIASNYPFDHELFIGKQWLVVDGKAVSPIEESRGVLLLRDDIRRIRFLRKPEIATPPND